MDVGKLTPAEVEASIKERYREAVEAEQVYELRYLLSETIYQAFKDVALRLKGDDLPEGFDNFADREAGKLLDELLRRCSPLGWEKLAAPVMSKEAARLEREHLLQTLTNIEAIKLPDHILKLAEDAARRITGVTPPTTPALQPQQDKQP